MMKRGRGTADDEGRSCPAAATAFGFGPLPEGLAAGKGPVGFGISVGAAVGSAMSSAVARLEPGRVGVLRLSCLDAGTLEPELVIVENEGREADVDWPDAPPCDRSPTPSRLDRHLAGDLRRLGKCSAGGRPLDLWIWRVRAGEASLKK